MSAYIDALGNEKFMARYWSKVALDGPGQCWEWHGGMSGRGYGVTHFRGRTLAAHRIAYVAQGRTISDGMVIDHICRNRLCVNPTHLRETTQAINSVENSLSIPAFNKVKTHCPQGHLYSLENTRMQRKSSSSSSRNCRTCHLVHSRRYKQKKRAALATPDVGEAKS